MAVVTVHTPSNRATARLCAVLLRAHREERIQMSWGEALMCRDALTHGHIHTSRRRTMWKLWMKHGGLELARRTDQIDRIPAEMREELSA